jgi:hypothetical protein
MDKYSKLIETLSVIEPLHEIWMDGYKYVIVYDIRKFPPSVYEALANEESL